MTDTVVDIDRRNSKHSFHPHSCKHCQRIIIYHNEVWRQDRPPNFYHGKVELPHDRSEVLQAVRDGCSLFTSFNFTSRSELQPQHRNALYRMLNAVSRLCSRDLTSVPPGPYFLEFSRSSVGLSWPNRDLRAVDRFHGSCFRKEPIMNVHSPEMVSTIKTWIDECCSSHKSCRFGTVDFTPTRLLEIGIGQRHVRLVDTEHKSFGGASFRIWASLSYVWGGDQAWKTLTNRLEEYHRGIPITMLPKTIQDAVTVCRSLQIPYLWVDSLCIIQDDTQDLENELATMHMIYRHALVTIVAACCRSSHDGFLHNRLSYHLHHRHSSRTLPPTKLTYRTKNGRDVSVGIYDKYLGEYGDEKIQNPIDDRAWTYQEQLLSPRVLLYFSDHFRWLCRSAERVGADPDDAWTKELRTGNYPSNNFVYPQTDVTGHRPEHQPLISWYDMQFPKYSSTNIQWKTIVANYSSRQISKPSDKLVALASIARQFQDKDPVKYNEYLAGLWKSELPSNLLWTSKKPRARPMSYRSPTWSWASVDGLVEPSYYSGALVRDPNPPPWDPALKIIRAETVLKSSRLPFGEVLSGRILVEGTTMSGTLHFARHSDSNHHMQFVPSGLNGGSRSQNPKLNRPIFEDFVSVLEDALDEGLWSMSKTNWGLPILLLALIKWEKKGSPPSFEGLVLFQRGGYNKFQRIGYFHGLNHDPDILDRRRIKYDKQTVTII